MNLNDIIQAAQGGQGVNNLAAQFGLTPDQAQAAVQAAIPAFSQGLQGATQDPNGLGGILGHLTAGVHQASYADPNQAGAATGAGGDVLGQIFGSSQVTSQISQQVSQASGISPQIIQQMMPVIASLVMGGLAHQMNSQGLGGVLGQLANAATQPGGLGSILGGAAAGQAGEPQSGGGMLGGLLNSVLGGLLGGGGAQSSTLQNGLNSLNEMLQPGVQSPPGHEEGISDILNSVSNVMGGGRS